MTRFRPSKSTWIAIALASAWVAFGCWYRSGGPALSTPEIDDVMNRLTSLDSPASEWLDPADTRRFLESDDGKPFFVVNLFRLRDGSGSEDLKEFSRRVVPLWARKGSHPVFVSELVDQPASSWQMVTVVRFRSRRDWADIVASDDFAAALPYRLAATESNLRLSFSGRLIPSPLIVLTLLALTAVLWVQRRESRSGDETLDDPSLGPEISLESDFADHDVGGRGDGDERKRSQAERLVGFLSFQRDRQGQHKRHRQPDERIEGYEEVELDELWHGVTVSTGCFQRGAGHSPEAQDPQSSR